MTSTRKPNKANSKRLRKFLRGLSENSITIAVLSRIAAWYLWLVQKTNRIVVEPADILETITPEQPLIVAVWHGQHILLPALPIDLPASAMISKNADGEITARVVEYFGKRTIRASGGRSQAKTLKKGGMVGFLEMLRALQAGDNVVQTADIPKGISRRVGLGIMNLSQKSECAIVPLAIASSRRYVFRNAWDKAALNLPFGTTAICVGERVRVPSSSEDADLENYRQTLEDELNRVTARAYELTGKPE